MSFSETLNPYNTRPRNEVMMTKATARTDRKKRRPVAKRAPQVMRERILNAAREQFSSVGYDQTGLRDIANAVGTDKRLVSHYFGSKERLFAEALDSAASKFQSPNKDMLSRFGENFATQMFGAESLSAKDRREFISLCIRSTSSAIGSELAKSNIERQIREFAVEMEGEDAMLRASILIAVLGGISLLREVLTIESLGEIGVEKTLNYISPILQGLIDASGGGTKKRSAKSMKSKKRRSPQSAATTKRSSSLKKMPTRKKKAPVRAI